MPPFQPNATVPVPAPMAPSCTFVVEAGGASYTVGVLVQSNYGGTLVVDGVEVGSKLPDPSTISVGDEVPVADGDGSIMMVVATDAPLDARLLERLARRAITGLARTGTSMSNGSGDYVIALSTRATASSVTVENAIT